MPEQLLQLDKHWFYLINSGMSNPVFDWLMPLLRNPLVWVPLYVFFIVFCIYRYKKTAIYIIVLLAATLAVADRGSAGLIKHYVKRARPCNDTTMAKTIILRIPCGSGYSFPSAHASNHFAIAAFICLVFYKRWKWIWLPALFWAAVISFAQVYVGVHYPADVIAGAIYGMAVAMLFALTFKKLQPDF